MRGLPNITYCTLTCQSLGIGEDMTSNMVYFILFLFINFEPLELY